MVAPLTGRLIGQGGESIRRVGGLIGRVGESIRRVSNSIRQVNELIGWVGESAPMGVGISKDIHSLRTYVLDTF